MVQNGLSLLSKNKKEVIMCFGQSSVVEKLFEKAYKEGYKFKVIVVDTCPDFHGRALVQRLSQYGVKCKYTLLSGIGALVTQTTQCFIGASYVLGNGGVVADAGTSMLAYFA